MPNRHSTVFNSHVGEQRRLHVPRNRGSQPRQEANGHNPLDQDTPGTTCTSLEARPVINLAVLGGQDPRPDIPGDPPSRSACARKLAAG